MITTDNTIFASVDEYINSLFAREDDTLKMIGSSIAGANLPNQSVSANQGKFLMTLALLCNARNILEIGTFGGYSTTWLAKALPADGKLISLESDPLHFSLATANIINADLHDKVEIRLGRGLDLLPELQRTNAGPFDMIFLDADKPAYVDYLDWAIRLSRRGSLIVADNVVRDGKVLDAHSTDEKVQGVQRFNVALSQDSRVTGTILQMVGIKDYDGMAIAVVR